jgi:putative transposase
VRAVSAGEDEENVRREQARAVGMFRYGLIRDAADPDLSCRERGRLVRALAEKEHIDPMGRSVRYSRDHLDRWIRRWRRDGFDALVPAGRSLYARTDPAVLEVAVSLKRERPGRTVAQIARILRAQSGWSPSETTLLRHFHRAGLQIPAGEAGAEVTTVFGRFEAERPNELWTGDALHGPRIAGRKTYLFAFIDDHTRLIVGHRWGFAEDTVRLAAALRPALASRGVPGSVYVDNGSAFVDAWLLRACAKLGIRLTHSTPGRPQGRGKIERFFRTVNDQFLVEIGPAADTLTPGAQAAAVIDPVVGLLELNRLFGAWVEQVYHRAWHSETGQTPLGRWAAGWDRQPSPGSAGGSAQPALPSAADLGEAFLWETTRTVRKNATVSLQSNTYQVEDALVGRRVELVFDPFDLTRIQVRYQGRAMGVAVPYQITRHSHPRARPEGDLAGPVEPPAATGINYLGLIVTAHEEQLAAGVNYAALVSTPPDPIDPSDPVEPDPVDLRLQAELDDFAAYLAEHRGELTASQEDLMEPPQPQTIEQIPGQLDLTDLLTTPGPDSAPGPGPDCEEDA